MKYNEQKEGSDCYKRNTRKIQIRRYNNMVFFLKEGNWDDTFRKIQRNWSPYIPRNIILRYSKKKDWILDQFLAVAQRLIEAKLLGRNAIRR